MNAPAEKLEERTDREAQGLAPKVEDPAVLARIAELMATGPKVEGSA